MVAISFPVWYTGGKNRKGEIFLTFREPAAADMGLLAAMMDEFYHSDAVLHPIPASHYGRTVQELAKGSPYAKAYLFEHDGETAGYALLAVTWSNEAGGVTVWVEEVYVRPQFQGKGIGKAFFTFLHQAWEGKAVRFRLETEAENDGARRLYQRLGYEEFPYLQMVREG